MGDRKIRVGSKVECRHGGGKKFFPGEVTSVAGSTVAILYDDGDTERDVPKFRARLNGQKQRKDLPVGMRVDAAFEPNGTQLFPAKVTKANFGGTYDLLFEDGDEGKKIARRDIQAEHFWPDDPVEQPDSPCARAFPCR